MTKYVLKTLLVSLCYIINITAQYTQIDDPNFEAALVALGYDQIANDGQVLTADIQNITTLNVSNKRIQSLSGIEAFTSLKILRIGSNPISELDLTANKLLESLSAPDCDISELKIDGLTSLTYLILSLNELTSLDVSTFPSLKQLFVNSNELTELNIRSGANSTLEVVDARRNEDLKCVFIDDLSDVRNTWYIDNQTSFRETDYCQYTVIPDSNFEAALEALGYDDISGDGQIPNALVENITSLNVKQKGITSLEGIEAFKALEFLDFNDNAVKELDVTNNKALRILRLRNNGVSSIDLKENKDLTFLLMENNGLTSLDVSQNKALKELYVGGNGLTEVDLSMNSALTIVGLNSNTLTSLNLRNGTNENITLIVLGDNSNLECITVDDPSYSTAKWTGIDPQMYFSSHDCRYTSVPDINFETALSTYDDFPNDNQVPTELIESITTLDISSSSISNTSGIESFVALTTLDASDNNFSSIKLNSLKQLQELYLQGAGVDSLDVKDNTALVKLNLNETSLTSLDISTNTLLEEVRVKDTGTLTEIKFGQHTALKKLDVSFNILERLDMSGLTALQEVYVNNNALHYFNIRSEHNGDIHAFDARNNSELQCILVDDATTATNNWTAVDDTTSFTSTNYCDYTLIEDGLFEAELGRLGYDDISGDGQVPTNLIKDIIELDVQAKGISKLTGIEDFTALKELNCSLNQLTSLDVSKNTELEILSCRTNNISKINLKENRNLKELNISDLKLDSLDISNNLLLEDFKMTGYSPIRSFDFSKHTALKRLWLQHNDVYILNLNNGKNANIVDLRIQDNSNLFCVLVDDIAYSKTHWDNIDTPNSYSATSCEYTYIEIPDTNFEAAIGALGYDDITNDGQVPLEYIDKVDQLDMRNKNISNFKGIAYFKGLKEFNCSGNSIDSLNLTTNTGLEVLEASGMGLKEINITDNKALKVLLVQNTALTKLDVSNQDQLEILQCHNTDISKLDITKNIKLKEINISNLGLDSLEIGNNLLLEDFKMTGYSPIRWFDFSKHKALKRLWLQHNDVFRLNLKNEKNDNFIDIRIQDNPNLSCVSVDNVQDSTNNWANVDMHTSFVEGYCYTPIPDAAFEARLHTLGYDDILGDGQVPTSLIDSITHLDLAPAGINNLSGIEAFYALTYLDVSNANLTTLDVSKNSNLTTIIAGESNIDTLNLGIKTNYETIVLNGNRLKDFEYTSLDNLKTLVLAGNPITDLDLSTFTGLEVFDCYSCNLSSLNIKNENNRKIVDFKIESNPNLTCVLVDDQAYSTTTWTSIDPQTGFNNSSTVDCKAPVINCANDITIDNDTGICGVNIVVPQPEVSDNYAVLAATSPITSYRFANNIKANLINTSTVVSNAVMLKSDVTIEITVRGAHAKRKDFVLRGPDGSTVYTHSNLGNCIERIKTTTVSQSVWNNWITTYGNNLTFTVAGNSFIRKSQCNNSYFSIRAYSIQGGLRFTNDYNNTEDASGFYHSGTTVVNWTATDDYGNTTTCSQSITVNDIEAPLVVSCSSDIEISNDTGMCGAKVTYDIPKAIVDNCVSGLTHLGSFGNKNYYLYDTVTTATEAFDIAESYKGFVATVDSKELNDWLRNTTNAIGVGNIFIGYTDRTEETVFKWHSGSTSDFNNWTGVEPNDFQGAEDYTIMKSNGSWNDVGASFTAKVVIEIDQEVSMVQVEGLPSGSEFPIGTTTNVYEATDAAGNTATCSFDVTVNDTEGICVLTLSPKVFLQGASLHSTIVTDGLMRDDLRSSGNIPTTSPYSDGVSCNSSVLATTGNDAIVDWVWVELRDQNNENRVITGQSALLQRDGDIVAVDGNSPLSFSATPNDYFTLVTHRNHLSILSASTLSLSNTITRLDLTSDTSKIQGGINAVIDMGNGVYAIPAGDTDGNGQIQNADINSANSTLGTSGYNNADMDMNGQVQNSDIQSVILKNSGKGEQISD